MSNSVAFDHQYEPVSAPTAQLQPDSAGASPRKRGRISDQDLDPKLIAKRAKAAERQRRKRERDRRNTLGAIQMTGQQHQQQPAGPSAPPNGPPTVPPTAMVPQLTKEEEERKNRVRAAARERQRKHRALVKQRKMAELGLTMGENGMMPEEVHYALQPDGQYQPVLPPNSHPQEMGQAENQYPPSSGAQTGGQTFASTLLLSLSCSPLLKAHLLRSLSMTNEELCSLEPILSAAWDQWDHARRLHYAEQVAQAGRQQQGDGQPQAESQQQNGSGTNNSSAPPPPHPFVPPAMPDQHDPNDFRSRFHRPLTAPSPFGTIPMSGAPGQIDPTLNGGTSSTSFAEAVAKVAMAANGQNVQANGVSVNETNADGGSTSDDAEAEVSTEKDELEVTTNMDKNET